MTELLFILAILLIGSFIQGASGFGFGLFAMSFLPFLFTVKESTLLVISLALITSISIIFKVIPHIQFRKLIILLSAAFVGRIGAFFILHNYGDWEILETILGVFLIAVVIYLFRSKRPTPAPWMERAWLPIVLGFFGGFIGGIFAVGGPFFVFYFLLFFSDDKYAYTANLQATFVFTNLITIITHGVNGDFSSEFLNYFLIGIFAVLIGSRLGMRWFKHLSQENIKKLAATVVAVAAINLILFG
ncbi:sulfite exporter TauE/SafE family protein [Texcoconibacillus texcoconensis]|uniref:Probable membrane transporter protein n=1 Tax=Texcoconibacillus texcoconensis TaxID=1095777 RepID=A0A840QLU5_9BACI|nr:sulfite exporter TauE/SafE family protein [Texcoconibacillus texcoconensis]MBB5172345.1 hypothetical protein [Texcoconibacillus texcoconensis]